MRQAGTIHSIQLLRSVAASLVVLFHTQQAFARGISQPLFGSEGYFFGFGAVGVHIFFVISGFIMVLTSCRPDRRFNSARFYQRRFLRIYPIYWFCVIAYIFVHYWLGSPYRLGAGETIGALALWPEHAPLIIGPAWTLSYEMFFYLCFGVAMTLGLSRGLVVLGTVFVGLIGLGLLVPDKGSAISLVTNPLLLEFLAGAGIGWLTHNGQLPRRGGLVIALSAVALFALGIATGYERLPSVAMWGLPSALLVLGIVAWEDRGSVSAMLVRWSRLGDSSYVLYLIHILIIAVALGLAGTVPAAFVPAPAIVAILLAVVAIVIAEIIHRAVEQPALAALQARIDARPQHAGPQASATDRPTIDRSSRN